MPRHFLTATILTALLGSVAGADETSIEFAPPPYPMTNMVVNDAIDGGGLDLMTLNENGFDMKCFSLGSGNMDRHWEKGGVLAGLNLQFIYGSLETGDSGGGGSDPFTLYGFGTNFPLNWYVDLLSDDVDDNSLPVFFGVHAGTMQMFGSMDYPARIIDHYDKIVIGPPINYTYYIPVYADITATQDLSIMQVQVGWQVGAQWGVNLGPYFKVIPYLTISQDVVNYNMTDISTSYSRYSQYAADPGPPDAISIKGNLGALPITIAPGFDIILRKLGVSLGGAWKSTEQAGGDMKQFNLHLRWSTKFRSICGL